VTGNAVLVVTGGSSGIGRATVRTWRERFGPAIALDLQAPQDVAEREWHVPCDVTDEEQVAGALAEVERRHGRMDAVFHNAGVLGPTCELSNLAAVDWSRVLDVHLTGGYLVAKHAVPALRRSGGGSVLFNASMVAATGSPFHPAYAAAKAGLVSLTQSLAPLLGRHSIRVNAVSPGSVPGTGLGDAGLTVADLAALMTKIPLRRAGTPSDIAEVACFLCSPAARHVTGAVVPVDGGERFAGVPIPGPPRSLDGGAARRAPAR
jgi:NAD(P)-dependent dehydrogenase (short-subunit alcohol dehydrogenase family)